MGSITLVIGSRAAHPQRIKYIPMGHHLQVDHGIPLLHGPNPQLDHWFLGLDEQIPLLDRLFPTNGCVLS
jgi:hypothetical protein